MARRARAPYRATAAHPDGLIYLNDLVSYVEDGVPDLSYRAFKLRQVPQVKIVGTNFPLVSKTAVLSDASSPPPALPVKPTHVVIVPAVVRQAASDGSAEVQQLPPGSQVALIETAGGWVLIACEGRKLGYVDAKTLLRLQ